MHQQVNLGDTILGRYQVVSLIEKTVVYQWLESIDNQTGDSCVVQLLLSDINSEKIEDIFNYFDALKSIRRKNINVPEQVISHIDFPLAVIYPQAFVTPLNLSKSLNPELLIQYLYEASETLHVLHNRDLIHGRINPKNFILKEDRVYLSGFGYAPILMLKNINIFKDYGDFLAPEAINNNDNGDVNFITTAIDIYAFAKTVAYWLPSVSTSNWYIQATNPTPNLRFRRMRDLFDELKQVITDLFSPKIQIIEPLEKIIIPNPETKFSGKIIPKHTIEIKVEPSEGGQVKGCGSYAEGREVQIEAIPFSDWEFLGWDGDIISINRSATNFKIIIVQDIKLVARFKLNIRKKIIDGVKSSNNRSEAVKPNKKSDNILIKPKPTNHNNKLIGQAFDSDDIHDKSAATSNSEQVILGVAFISNTAKKIQEPEGGNQSVPKKSIIGSAFKLDDEDKTDKMD